MLSIDNINSAYVPSPLKNFRTLDLNLLRVFDSLMSEGSLSRAADALALTQPAASHALKRLHSWYGEPLFQRTAAGMKPNSRAQALWPQVRSALLALQQALAPAAFDPRTDRAEFRLAMGHATAGALLPELARALEQGRVAADLRVVQLTTRDPRPLLQGEQADLAIGHFPALVSSLLTEGERALFRHERLHETEDVCVMRREHPLAQAPLTLDAYCAAQHVEVSVSGDAYTEVDEALALAGRRRRVPLTVNQFSVAGRIVASSDLLGVLPASLVASAAPPDSVVARPLPVRIQPLTVDMVWLARREPEAAHRWLRELVRAGARVMDSWGRSSP